MALSIVLLFRLANNLSKTARNRASAENEPIIEKEMASYGAAIDEERAKLEKETQQKREQIQDLYKHVLSQ